MRFATMGVWLVLCTLLTQQARAAAYGDDLGYISLTNELGSNTPNGAGVSVTQVEAPLTNNAKNDYFPDTTNSEFSGKTITARTASPATSSHATGVGQYFYGNSTSMAPGITTVNAYNANYWVGSGTVGSGTEGFLNGNSQYLPNSTTDRVANHSYVGPFNSETLDLLHRMDYVIQHDDYINVVAVNNPKGGITPLFSSSFNAISVGLSNGTATSGTGTIDSLYVSGRATPDIVAPQDETSFATPTVASVAAILVQYADKNGSLSNGSITTSRGGVTLTRYYAETSDVIKAALMAGAVRQNLNASASQQIPDYRPGYGGVQNGLDSRYGAGQLNVYNSYHVIAAGQQTPTPSGMISTYGFDYNPAAGANLTADYKFTGDTAIASSLVWNAHVDNSLTASLAHFSLTLYLLNADGSKAGTVVPSTSPIDNTQNIFIPFLHPDDTYELEVNRTDQLGGTWDYGLAWNLSSVPEPGSLCVLVTGAFTLLSRRPRRRCIF